MSLTHALFLLYRFYGTALDLHLLWRGNMNRPIFLWIGLYMLSLTLSSSAAFATDHQSNCSHVAGTYISKNFTVVNVDTGTSTVTNRLLQIHSEGTFSTYYAAQLNNLGEVGNQSIPSLGSWVCSNDKVVGVAYDYFAFGSTIGGHPICCQEWNEFDRITIEFDPATLILRTRLIGIAQSDDGGLLNPHVPATVVSAIRTSEMKKVTNIKAIVSADFAR